MAELVESRLRHRAPLTCLPLSPVRPDEEPIPRASSSHCLQERACRDEYWDPAAGRLFAILENEHVHNRHPARYQCGADADPLGVRALCVGRLMTALLIILLATIGLSVRAGVYGRRWDVAESDSGDGYTSLDAYARTFILVLLSLLGLFALGMTYGNVLGHPGQ